MHRRVAVTAIQRANSDLRLSPQFHTLFLDGIYGPDRDGDGLMFHPAPAPTQEDIEQLVERVSRRILRFLQRREVITLVSAPGDGEVTVVPDETLGEKVPLLGYILRQPLANERLSILDDGNVRLDFKQPWSNGTSWGDLPPLARIARLAALVPPPRRHLTRYCGVLSATEAPGKPARKSKYSTCPRKCPSFTPRAPLGRPTGRRGTGKTGSTKRRGRERPAGVDRASCARRSFPTLPPLRASTPPSSGRPAGQPGKGSCAAGIPPSFHLNDRP